MYEDLPEEVLHARGHDSRGGLTAATRLSEELDRLLELLREHRGDDSRETERVAIEIASACAGDDHLWEDMGLPSRETLSGLIRRHFPTLFRKNTSDMRWKKFFYKQLCDRAQASVCRAPSCGSCSDYALCFGPE